jgi:hypothetical protein
VRSGVQGAKRPGEARRTLDTVTNGATIIIILLGVCCGGVGFAKIGCLEGRAGRDLVLTWTAEIFWALSIRKKPVKPGFFRVVYVGSILEDLI